MTGACGCRAEGCTCGGELAGAGRTLDGLSYRVGTHADFLGAMKRRLSARDLPALAGLTTRAADDPSIAILDAWATVADVLSFYQERIANEGYLLTASERRSVLELARLVGYRLRPGVAASVYLAFTLQEGYDVLIPAGTRAQSIPAPGQLPQFYETHEPLRAYSALNAIRPRLTRPPTLAAGQPIHLVGQVNVLANDGLLFKQKQSTTPEFYKAQTAKLDLESGSTILTLVQRTTRSSRSVRSREPAPSIGQILRRVIPKLPAQLVPANPQRLERTPADVLDEKSSLVPKLFELAHPETKGLAHAALANTSPAAAPNLEAAWVMRSKAGFFGSNAPALVNVLDEEGSIVRQEPPPFLDEEAVELDVLTNTVIIRSGGDGRSFEVGEGNSGRFVFRNTSVQFKIVHATAGPLTTLLIQTQPGGEDIALDVTIQSSDPVYRVVTLKNSDLTVEDVKGAITKDKPLIVRRDRDAVSVHITDNRPRISFTRTARTSEAFTIVDLDTINDRIVPGSWVAVVDHTDKPSVTQVKEVRTGAVTRYGLTAKVTTLTLARPWREPAAHRVMLADMQAVEIYAQSESVPLAETPIDTQVGGSDDEPERELELESLYPGLEPGRWLIISGERVDLGNTTAITGTELAMIESVRQDAPLMGKEKVSAERLHTFVTLASPLQHRYARSTVRINANVALATHGETKTETLGNGDGTTPFATFALRQPPLTYLPAPNASGAQSTLEVRVDRVRWREADGLDQLGPGDRGYAIKIDDDGRTSVIFGDGQNGSRVPTGVENITAVYRSGIGAPGNAAAGQIAFLVTQPAGVRAVSNPLPATGGADREGVESARRNAPLPLRTLGKLVSVKDHAYFARTFAGIAKASATRLSDGQRDTVHITVAGAADTPVRPDGELYRNLVDAIAAAGDRRQAVIVEPRELITLVVNARVRVHADHLWEDVEPRIRAALLDELGFDKRELAEAVTASQVIRIIQRVRGVDYVDLDALLGIDQRTAGSAERLQAVLEGQRPDPFTTVRAALAGPEYFLVEQAISLPDLATQLGLAAVELVALNPFLSATEELPEGTEVLVRRIRPAELLLLHPDLPETLQLLELPR